MFDLYLIFYFLRHSGRLKHCFDKDKIQPSTNEKSFIICPFISHTRERPIYYCYVSNLPYTKRRSCPTRHFGTEPRQNRNAGIYAGRHLRFGQSDEPANLHDIKAQIILGNTYHLWLRPGLEVIEQFGGLHEFIGWDKPILTDSGGFQVFSLSDMRKLTEEGCTFQSPINGDKLFLSPEVSMKIQTVLNSDIVMQLDECTPGEATHSQAQKSLQMSLRWAERSKKAFEDLKNPNALFGIVQGAMYEDLREESLKGLEELDFPRLGHRRLVRWRT